MPYTIKPGSFKYKKSNGQFSEIDCFEGPDSPVTDVQINGTTILDAQGVANVPVAGSNSLGIVKIGNGLYASSAGNLYTNKASDVNIKAGNEDYKPIVSSNQHKSVFYALAKLAGADMSSSSNAIGNFTPEAIVAIQKMLGVYQAPWELIREDTVTNAEEADIEITVDGNGQPLNLTDIILMFETPVQNSNSAKGEWGAVYFIDDTTVKVTTYTNSWTQEAGTTAHGMFAQIEQKDSLIFVSTKASGTSTNPTGIQRSYREGFNGATQGILYDNDFNITKINIRKVTGTGHYIIYGKRKWTT